MKEQDWIDEHVEFIGLDEEEIEKAKEIIKEMGVEDDLHQQRE